MCSEVSTLDKYEYKVRSEEIKSLVDEKNFKRAAEIADTIDWRRVKSVLMLCTISDIYKMVRRYEDSKALLLLAYEKRQNSRMIVYALTELCVKLNDVVRAWEYYKEFCQIAPDDNRKYILLYKIYVAQDVSLEEQIKVLETYKEKEYTERWAFELAYLYHRIGFSTKCVEECDEIIRAESAS
jgi:tetratricopeptide (TPR) repeat protein